ncbi:DUF1642 domain-containing protein [Tetragenococcus halophilus]|uniref:DUF1642 domain-containing protein n=1 Tax=Tetragenococcus halophilus TaxID=51669 RepID=A0AB35HRF0_TETHA|nr:DUF1642 domain-containing protein [Tetragenococcus halophilus]MCO8298665.1 DUF1642 domain-containing protein [Tetragenococcus halophilus]
MDKQELIEKYEKLIQQNEPELEESKLAESRSKLYNNILRELKRMDDGITTEQAWEKIAEEYKLPVETVQQIAGTTISSAVKKEDIAIRDGCIILNPNLTEPEKPEIPKFVADWIEEVKQRGCGLADALNCFVSPIMPEKVKQWIQFDFAVIGCHHDNQELLAKAWLNGYTIEKEPVWVVLKDAQYFHAFTGEYDKFEGFEYVLSMYEGNAHTFADKQKAEAVATLVDGTFKEWSE